MCVSLCCFQYEPLHDKTNKITARSEDSDQPGVWSVLLCAQWVTKDPSFLHADSEDSDQTGQIPGLIRVFAGCTCHFVGFVMRWLILPCMETKLSTTQKFQYKATVTYLLINELKLVSEKALFWDYNSLLPVMVMQFSCIPDKEIRVPQGI